MSTNRATALAEWRGLCADQGTLVQRKLRRIRIYLAAFSHAASRAEDRGAIAPSITIGSIELVGAADPLQRLARFHLIVDGEGITNVDGEGITARYAEDPVDAQFGKPPDDIFRTGSNTHTIFPGTLRHSAKRRPGAGLRSSDPALDSLHPADIDLWSGRRRCQPCQKTFAGLYTSLKFLPICAIGGVLREPESSEEQLQEAAETTETCGPINSSVWHSR